MIIISKTRKQKLKEYDKKYNDIPKDYCERISWMIDNYHLTKTKMDEIIFKRNMMEQNLYYNSFKIVLYEDPEGAKRPRFRLINRNNYMQMAIANPSFIQVYSPNAASDNKYMHRLVDDELVQLTRYIQTPCTVELDAYIKTPSYFNSIDIFLAEIGLHRPISKPDWDNIGKKYSDMLNSNIWLDDALVISGSVNKFYSILPRIEIIINYLNYATSIMQYNSIVNNKHYNEEYPIEYLNKYGGRSFNYDATTE